ncbi:glycosyltransferase [Rhodopirellula sallentina]|uniref:Group 1 family glycosyl transferase n=1 Tax=Rhodopirellula sallentina SM41 TaxID=1263870 RepID=M5U646_9BACT|nr:glycosyltransferase [Rhodopirellula sallentina]EMI56925.1 group 1 family glycosyl transferase [Rhodopirellula sallentina SM41]
MLRGGHVLSALTIARELRKHGVTPVFAGGEGELMDEMKKEMDVEVVDIPIYHGVRESYFTWASPAVTKRILEVVKKHKIDLIHAFDARSYMNVYPASIISNVPVLCTLCGGVDPFYNLPTAPSIIVFSEEQKKRMTDIYKWNPDAVVVMRSRIDHAEIHDARFVLGDCEAKSIGLDPQAFKIMMISSFDSSKIDSINSVLDSVELLIKDGLKIQLVMMGGKGELFESAKRRGESICNQYGSGKVLFTGPVAKAFRYLHHSNLVLGVGRSAFEGMAIGRPTIVVGKNGYAGVVDSRSVDDIAWFNFSGRNVSEPQPAEALAAAIKMLMLNPKHQEEIGAFGKQYLEDQIEVSAGVPTTLAIYRSLLECGHQASRIARWLSFLQRLLPIVRDNSIHTAKRVLQFFGLTKLPIPD